MHSLGVFFDKVMHNRIHAGEEMTNTATSCVNALQALIKAVSAVPITRTKITRADGNIGPLSFGGQVSREF